MPEQESHYTVIVGTADGEPRLEVMSAAELRKRLTRNKDGETYYGHGDQLRVLTSVGRLDLCADLNEDTIIILRGEPVADCDPWRFGAPDAPAPDSDPAPDPSPGLPALHRAWDRMVRDKDPRTFTEG